MAEELLNRIRQCVVGGDAEGASGGVRRALEAGITAERVIDEALAPGIQEVGDRFDAKEFFLPDLMLGARAMEAGMQVASAAIAEAGQELRKVGTAVLGTVQGDIHEIGKNLVALLMRVNGFEVHDLGVNVSTAQFLEAVQKYNPDIVGMSCLLTVTMSKQKDVIRALRAARFAKQPRVMVGGAPINQQWADEIGADGYSPDAAQAVRDAKKLLQVAV